MRDHRASHAGAGGGCGRSSAINRGVAEHVSAEKFEEVLKPGMVIMAEPNPITPDGLFGIFLGHTFIVTDDGHGVVDDFPLAGSLAAQRGRGGLPRFEKHNLNARDKGYSPISPALRSVCSPSMRRDEFTPRTGSTRPLEPL